MVSFLRQKIVFFQCNFSHIVTILIKTKLLIITIIIKIIKKSQTLSLQSEYFECKLCYIKYIYPTKSYISLIPLSRRQLRRNSNKLQTPAICQESRNKGKERNRKEELKGPRIFSFICKYYFTRWQLDLLIRTPGIPSFFFSSSLIFFQMLDSWKLLVPSLFLISPLNYSSYYLVYDYYRRGPHQHLGACHFFHASPSFFLLYFLPTICSDFYFYFILLSGVPGLWSFLILSRRDFVKARGYEVFFFFWATSIWGDMAEIPRMLGLM